MLFKDTYRFSPVAQKVDMPFETDLFYQDVNDIPDNEKQLTKFLKDTGIENDEEWWYKQYKRVKEGFTIDDAIVKGGNAIIDGRDAIWNETAKPMEFYNDNFNIPIIIPPETVYLNDADIYCPQGNLTITGRHYFYLNFFRMYSEDLETGKKDISPPHFLDMDFLKFARIRLQQLWGKDNTELKARQLGFSKTSAGGILCYNFLFERASHSVIVAGNDEDADELYATAADGIELMRNTQFYKAIGMNSKTKHRLSAKYYKSRISAFTAGSGNDQVLSRLVPYWVVYEEVGKWAKGLVESVRMFVEPSIVTKGQRFGYQTFIGTGGDMELAADDMEQMHYSLDSDTFLRFKNKFERNGAGNNLISGWFSSKAWFSVVDKDGNSDLVEGAKYVLSIIEKEKDAVKKHIKITQWALYAQDAFMMSSAGFFGETKINLMNSRLSEIKMNRSLQIERHGILEWKNPASPFEGVNFVETEEIDSFITIIEEPLLDKDGSVYRGVYEIGIDSYDQDESQTTTSMGALVITKGFLDYETTSNIDIALLLERPDTKYGGKNLFYEHCAMAGVWCGNVQMVIEHTRVLIIEWLINNGFESIIALRPRMAFAAMVNKSSAMNKYGVDGSMKPHVMAIQSKRLTADFIKTMFITKQIKALIRYKYARNYNCDITVATAHGSVAIKENDKIVAYSINDKKSKDKGHHFYYQQTPNGLIRVFA